MIRIQIKGIIFDILSILHRHEHQKYQNKKTYAMSFQLLISTLDSSHFVQKSLEMYARKRTKRANFFSINFFFRVHGWFWWKRRSRPNRLENTKCFKCTSALCLSRLSFDQDDFFCSLCHIFEACVCLMQHNLSLSPVLLLFLFFC